MLEQPQWKKHYRSGKPNVFSGGGRGGATKGHGQGNKGDKKGGNNYKRDGMQSFVV
jgi:hypothetical protein